MRNHWKSKIKNFPFHFHTNTFFSISLFDFTSITNLIVAPSYLSYSVFDGITIQVSVTRWRQPNAISLLDYVRSRGHALLLIQVNMKKLTDRVSTSIGFMPAWGKFIRFYLPCPVDSQLTFSPLRNLSNLPIAFVSFFVLENSDYPHSKFYYVICYQNYSWRSRTRKQIIR